MAEPPSEIVFESVQLIGRTTILGAFYGVAFSLYCLCARLLYLQLQEPDQRRRARLSLGYISVLMFCTLGSLGVNTGMMQLVYVKHRDFPGGPLGFQAQLNAVTTGYALTASVFDFIVLVSILATQIWRLRMVWGGTRYATIVIILPLLLLFAFIAFFIIIAMVFAVKEPEQLGIPMRTAFAIEVAAYAVPSALTVFATALIAGRILFVRKRHVEMLGTSDSSSPYTTIVAMLVESYALESAWSLATAISTHFNSPSLTLLATNDSSVKVIAYFLIVYRVATSRGWTPQTERELTSLQWNHGGQTATDSASDLHSHVLATTAEVAEKKPVSSSRTSV